MRVGLPNLMKGSVGSVSPQLVLYLDGTDAFSETFGGGGLVVVVAFSKTSGFIVVLKWWVMDNSVTLSPK